MQKDKCVALTAAKFHEAPPPSFWNEDFFLLPLPGTEEFSIQVQVSMSESSSTGSADTDIEAGPRNYLGEIYRDPALLGRLKLWEKQDLDHRQRKDTLDYALRERTNEIYQILGFFFVFDGVVLTALAQASKLGCKGWWIPLSLVLIADAAATLGVIYKARGRDCIKGSINKEKAMSQALDKAIDRLRNELGKDYDPYNIDHQPNLEPEKKRKRKLIFKSRTLICLGIQAFSGILAVSCKLILCG